MGDESLWQPVVESLDFELRFAPRILEVAEYFRRRKLSIVGNYVRRVSLNVGTKDLEVTSLVQWGMTTFDSS